MSATSYFTLLHYGPQSHSPCLFPDLCLCFLDSLQMCSACPNLLYPCFALPEANPSTKNAVFPIPIPNLINPFFFNIQFKVIPQEEETTPIHDSMPTLRQFSCRLLEGMDFTFFMSASPTTKQELEHSAHPANVSLINKSVNE